MRANVKVDESGTVRVGDIVLSPHYLRSPEGPREPMTLGPGYTFECTQSDLLGRAIVVYDGEGDPIYGFSIWRPGFYILDEHSFTYVDMDIPTQERPLVAH